MELRIIEKYSYKKRNKSKYFLSIKNIDLFLFSKKLFYKLILTCSDYFIITLLPLGILV